MRWGEIRTKEYKGWLSGSLLWYCLCLPDFSLCRRDASVVTLPWAARSGHFNASSQIQHARPTNTTSSHTTSPCTHNYFKNSANILILEKTSFPKMCDLSGLQIQTILKIEFNTILEVDTLNILFCKQILYRIWQLDFDNFYKLTLTFLSMSCLLASASRVLPELFFHFIFSLQHFGWALHPQRFLPTFIYRQVAAA